MRVRDEREAKTRYATESDDAREKNVFFFSFFRAEA